MFADDFDVLCATERARCFRSFLNNHWLGFAVFAGIAVDLAWRYKAWPRAL